MSFIDAYKQLEKLCGEILSDDRRISAYIDEMLNTPQGSHLVRGWDEDLKQLKHYRWIRNRIVHDPGCNERNMCSEDDTQWLVNFYSRIMNRKDPLALYRQATQTQRTPAKKKTDSQHNQERYYDHHQNMRNPSGCGIALLTIVVITVVVAIWWLVKLSKFIP